MKSVRILESDHAELVKRREETGASFIFQISKLIADSKKDYDNDQKKDTPTLPVLPK